MAKTVHVIPKNDLIGHEESEDCGCIPVIEPVKAEDGAMRWIVTHNAWDGRE